MTIDNVFQEFVDRFPEIKSKIFERIDKYIDEGDGVEVYWDWGIIFLIYDLIQTGSDIKKNEKILKKIFAFFEEMTYSEDVRVIKLLMDYTLDPLSADREQFSHLIRFMGKRLMILYRIVCQTTYPPIEEFDEIGPAYLKHYYAKGEQSWKNCYLDFIDEWVRKSEED